MSDQKIIDLSNVKVLREHDQELTAESLRSKMEFVNVANEIIHKVIGKTDFEFFQVFKHSMPTEVLDDFSYRKLSLDKMIEDLNILGKIEKMVGLNSIIFAPTCTCANLTGWIAGFHSDKCMFSSPEMDSEAKARAFNILLFLRLREVLKLN